MSSDKPGLQLAENCTIIPNPLPIPPSHPVPHLLLHTSGRPLLPFFEVFQH